MRFKTALLCTALCFASFAVHAANSFVLPYRAQNEWVAVGDNASLQELVKLAKKGQNKFYAVLPAENRQLSVNRLVILMEILNKYAKGAVNITEVSGKAKANTLLIYPYLPKPKTPAAAFNAAAQQ